MAFVLFSAVRTDLARSAFAGTQNLLIEYFGWFYLLTASLLLVFALCLLFSRFGHIRLGPPDSRPEFGNAAWFSMLLSAGMGIGIVFFGAAEPLQHYLSPPEGEGRTPEALADAMRYTFFHWGLHPWAIYTALALPLAYFHFRHDLPLAPRSLLYPLLGERIHGVAGHAADVVCIVGTLFGVATSLGLGTMQINAGLGRLFGIPETTGVQLLLIAGITLIATISVLTGLHRGIRWLSKFNIGLAGFLLAFVVVTGPTLYILETFLTGLGHYLQKLPVTSLEISPGTEDGWRSRWTLFYWSWWISWAPFVGVFVARISRGRTVREFILTTLLVPTLGGFLWFAALGGTTLHAEIIGGGGIAEVVRSNEALALFAVLEQLPFHRLTWVLATLLVIVFFITSSDSGSLVNDMVSSGGHPNPPRIQRVFWALTEGAVAAVLLHAGGLQALRSASLATGIAVALFLLIACRGMIRALHAEAGAEGVPSREALSSRQPPGADRDRR
jgi:choline/glycine/proline betaine transport protein